MKLRSIAAAVALAVGCGNAAAVVLTPNTAGGSELVFFMANITESDFGMPGGTTSYSHDLGIQIGSFNANVSHAWQLAPSFNIFKDPARYGDIDTSGCGTENGLICSFGTPDFDNGIGPGTNLWWGVVGADSTAPGSAKVMTTYGLFNDLLSGTDGDGDLLTAPAITSSQIVASANRLNDAWTDDGITGPPPDNRYELNSIPGHAGIENGARLIKAEDYLIDPNGNLLPANLTEEGLLYANGGSNLYRSDVFGFLGDTQLNIRADPFEQVPMYLFTEGAGVEGTSELQPGTWYIRWTDNVLVYEVAGSEVPDPVPAPVPLPAAVWLLGSALMGMAAIGRRKPAA